MDRFCPGMCAAGGAHPGHGQFRKGPGAGKTLQAIRRQSHNFCAMNVFGDGEAAGKLQQLKVAIAGPTGQALTRQPDVAAKLAGDTCSLWEVNRVGAVSQGQECPEAQTPRHTQPTPQGRIFLG